MRRGKCLSHKWVVSNCLTHTRIVTASSSSSRTSARAGVGLRSVRCAIWWWMGRRSSSSRCSTSCNSVRLSALHWSHDEFKAPCCTAYKPCTRTLVLNMAEIQESMASVGVYGSVCQSLSRFSTKSTAYRAASFERIFNDEAHALRDREHTENSRLFPAFDARYRWFVTRTPVLKSLVDLQECVKLPVQGGFSYANRDFKRGREGLKLVWL